MAAAGSMILAVTGLVGAGAASAGGGLAATVRGFEVPPTGVPITTRLKATPPKGKTFVYLECDQAQCTAEADTLKAVTKAIHWNLKVIPYQSANPATVIAGFQQALQYHPAGVSISGAAESEWASVLPSYAKAGVPIVPSTIGPSPINKVIIANIGNSASFALQGKEVGDYFALNAGGTAKVLQFQVPSFPILTAFDTEFDSTVKSQCPGCTVSQLDGTLTEVGSGGEPAAIVSALQADPSIGWVVTDDSAWTDGLPSALAAAGLSNIKVIGGNADVVSETDIDSGTMSAFTAADLNYACWAMVDAVLRHVEGMKEAGAEGALPTQLLVKGVSFAVSEAYNEPTNVAALMKKLWKVG